VEVVIVKKILILVILLPFYLNAGRGGAIAGGILGGMFLGSMIANASRPSEVVYVQQPQSVYQPLTPVYAAPEYEQVPVIYEVDGLYFKDSAGKNIIKVSEINNEIYLQDVSGNYIKPIIKSLNSGGVL
jgi:hypothetical protein